MSARENNFKFSETYLFKVNALKNALDKAFDQILRRYAKTTLSQLLLLLSVLENEDINQRGVAAFLGISSAAVNRQVDIATRAGLLGSRQGKGKSRPLFLTSSGRHRALIGIETVNLHLSKLFIHEDKPISFMAHIDLTLVETKGVIEEKRPSSATN